VDPLPSLIRRWRLKAGLYVRTGHPEAAVRSVNNKSSEEALPAFVNEALNQTATARLLEIDPATVRRSDRTQRLRNIGLGNRPLYLRAEIQKLPPEWGKEGGEPCNAIGTLGLLFFGRNPVAGFKLPRNPSPAQPAISRKSIRRCSRRWTRPQRRPGGARRLSRATPYADRC
jgi:hypothetical protein